jgi:hypothetical protein
MCGAILPLSQYTFMAWCSVKAQGQLFNITYNVRYEMAKSGKAFENSGYSELRMIRNVRKFICMPFMYLIILGLHSSSCYFFTPFTSIIPDGL